MNILENAKKDFQGKVSGELLCIEVAEWGDDGTPAKIYYRPVMSLKNQNRINQYAKDGSLEALVESLIIRSLDAEGKAIFKPVNKTELMTMVDPAVIGRVCEEMGKDDTTIEDASGN